MANLDYVSFGPDYRYGGEDEYQDPTGVSALRKVTRLNPRVYSCPTCKARNRLTRADRDLGYQCDACADRLERGGL
jgi:hypothetical protein